MNDTRGGIERFCGLAQAYERYRPGYPSGAIAAIVNDLPRAADIADVGAGTGISTRALAAAGTRPIAIEPNAEMRAVALAQGCDARDGTAAATRLVSLSVDAVTAFQAFHWFARADALAEFARILRRAGRLAIVWNERTRDDPFTAAFRDLERRHGEPAMLAGIEYDEDMLGPLLQSAGFCNLRLQTFANAQRVDRDALIGRVCSTSYAPRQGAALEALVLDLHALYERFANASGVVEIRYTTEVFLADLSAS